MRCILEDLGGNPAKAIRVRQCDGNVAPQNFDEAYSLISNMKRRNMDWERIGSAVSICHCLSLALRIIFASPEGNKSHVCIE